jgi:uncharacterized membrane protein
MTPSEVPPSRELHVQRYLITGMLTLFPVWLTWVVFKFIFNLLSGASAPWVAALFTPLANAFPIALGWLGAAWVQAVVALLMTLVLVYVVGRATNAVLGQRILAGFEALVLRIPLAQSVYGGAKKLLEAMQPAGGAQRVVLVEFPHPGVRTVGFVTRMLTDANDGREYAAVFVPTTPNPTGGFLQIVAVERIIPTDWTVEQAMAFILSGGAIAPANFSLQPTAARIVKD